MQFRLRTLLMLMVAFAVASGLLRGVLMEPEPYWGLYLIGLTTVLAGIDGIFIAGFDRKPTNS